MALNPFPCICGSFQHDSETTCRKCGATTTDRLELTQQKLELASLELAMLTETELARSSHAATLRHAAAYDVAKAHRDDVASAVQSTIFAASLSVAWRDMTAFVSGLFRTRQHQ